MKKTIFTVFIWFVCLGYLGADVFEFKAFFQGKEPSQHWDRRYRYIFEDGLLASIETSFAAYGTGEIVRQKIVTIKRYEDRLEAYKDDNLYLTIYYGDSNTVYMVRADAPEGKWLLTIKNNEASLITPNDQWRIRIIFGEEIVFRINNNNIAPWIDFIVTGKDPSTIRYDQKNHATIYEKTGNNEYDLVTYADGYRDVLTHYTVIPPTEKYKIYMTDFLIDYYCGEDFDHLFWGQLITRSENRLFPLHE